MEQSNKLFCCTTVLQTLNVSRYGIDEGDCAADIVVDSESYVPGLVLTVTLPEGRLHEVENEFC
jgi:hypothetical protein